MRQPKRRKHFTEKLNNRKNDQENLALETR